MKSHSKCQIKYTFRVRFIVMFIPDKLGFSTCKYSWPSGICSYDLLKKKPDCDEPIVWKRTAKVPELLELGIVCFEKNCNLMVEFSPSRIATGGIHNMMPLNQEEYNEQLVKVYSLLKKTGFKCDMWEDSPYRFDSAIDCTLDWQCHHFEFFIRQLNLMRKRLRRYKNTWYMENVEKTIAVYDKLGALSEEERKVIPFDYLGIHIIRWEHRFRTARALRDSIGVTTVRETVEQFPKFEEYFKQVLRRLYYGTA